MFLLKEREKKKCQTDGILFQKGEPEMYCTMITNNFLNLMQLLTFEALKQLANN